MKTTKVNDVEVMSHSAFLIEGHCPQAALFFVVLLCGAIKPYCQSYGAGSS